MGSVYEEMCETGTRFISGLVGAVASYIATRSILVSIGTGIAGFNGIH